MIAIDGIQISAAGIHIPSHNVWVDARQPVDHGIITHAHADHTCLGHGISYCTPATYHLMKARYKNLDKNQFVLVDYYQDFEINNAPFQLLPSGHMLGSAMVHFTGNIDCLITGDWKMQADDSCTAVDLRRKAALLITETTFAKNGCKHPDPIQAMELLINDHRPCVVGVYALGKAQRMLHLIQQHMPNRPVMVQHEIARFNAVYLSHQVLLPSTLPYHSKKWKSSENTIYLCNMHTLSSFKKHTNVGRYFCSGWNKLFNWADGNIPISDHADWFDLLNLVEQTKPRKIVAYHGDGTQLKEFLDIPVYLV
jgi:putative mRNA 3-end processing factor